MGILKLRKPQKNTIRLETNVDPFVFYGLGKGHAIFRKDLKRRSLIVGGPKIPLSCMFEVYWLLYKKEKVGYYLRSQFQTSNQGGYLVTYMNSGAGKASMVEVLLKTAEMVIYNYPNRGTLAISTKINEEVRTILSEQ